MTALARRWNTTACWIRGISFAVLVAPVCGAAILIGLLMGYSAIVNHSGSLSPGGFPFIALIAVVTAAPVALVSGVIITAVALRWASVGVTARSLTARLSLVGAALGALSGLTIGIPSYPLSEGWLFGETVALLLPLGTVTGLFAGGLFPRALGLPYRRLASGPV